LPGDFRAVSRVPLLIGFLTGPIVWSLHLTISEFLIASACSSGPAGFHGFTILGASGWRFVLVLLTAVFAIIVVAAGAIAYRAWLETHAGTQLTGATGGAVGRSGWMALAGVLLSALFLIAIVLESMPVFWLNGCT